MSAEIQDLRQEIRDLRSGEIKSLADGQPQILVHLGPLHTLPVRVEKLEENQASMMASLAATGHSHRTIGRVIERYAPWIIAVLLGGKVGADMVLMPSAAVPGPEIVETIIEPQ